MLGCALGCAGWGHLRLHWNVSVGFGASGWLVLWLSWAWDSFTVYRVLLVIIGWGPVVCLRLVSSFRIFSKFIFWINQLPKMIKFSS